MAFGISAALGPLISGYLIRYGFVVPFAFGAVARPSGRWSSIHRSRRRSMSARNSNRTITRVARRSPVRGNGQRVTPNPQAESFIYRRGVTDGHDERHRPRRAGRRERSRRAVGRYLHGTSRTRHADRQRRRPDSPAQRALSKLSGIPRRRQQPPPVGHDGRPRQARRVSAPRGTHHCSRTD
jgi:hypothetical protein